MNQRRVEVFALDYGDARRILAAQAGGWLDDMRIGKLLLHFLLGAVAFAGDDVVFERLVFFVLNAERLAFVVD